MKKFLLFTIIFSILFLVGAKLLNQRVIFQITPSMPKGVYWIDKNTPVEVGSIIVFKLPAEAARLIKERKWWPLSLKHYLMKPVVANRGDHVMILKGNLYINEKLFGTVQKFDSKGLPLPEMPLDRFLLDDEYFMASHYEKSFDSRYFGVIKKESVLGVAKKII